MYGLIHCCLRDLVLKIYGEKTWKLIVKSSGIDLNGGEYLIHENYADQETIKLINATQSISGIELDEILEMFGQNFFDYCTQLGYDRILKVLGRNLREFLSNLDALHDHLANSYPGMNAPSFRIAERADGGIDLHYYSNRQGLCYIVVGIIKQFAKKYLNSSVKISIEKRKDENFDHDVLCIKEIIESFNGKEMTVAKKSSFIDGSTSKSLVKMSSLTFMSTCSFTKAFPFHVIFDRELKLIQCGVILQRYLLDSVATPGISTGQMSFLDKFKLIRPKMNQTFENILAHINTVYVVSIDTKFFNRECHFRDTNRTQDRQAGADLMNDKNKHDPFSNSSATSSMFSGSGINTENMIQNNYQKHFDFSNFSMERCCSKQTNAKALNLSSKQSNSTGLKPVSLLENGPLTSEMKLKGQMFYLPKVDCMLFLCSPRAETLEELKLQNLYLCEIPLHDMSKELIITKHLLREDKELVKSIEDSTNNLKILQSKLIYKKQITDDLLHELLPKHVATKLRLNEEVPVENISMVSILFSDLVGFTSLCSNEKVVPMDIIKLLNQLYTAFDAISSTHGVYKVETIGDAYMGVAGIPEQTRHHAEMVASMACDMMDKVTKISSPVDSHPIQIRVGIHSGSVMAGVVGKKMPRYCLFGQTVAIANSLESTSSPGKIHVSSEARKYLNSNDWAFEENQKKGTVSGFFVTKVSTNSS